MAAILKYSKIIELGKYVRFSFVLPNMSHYRNVFGSKIVLLAFSL